MIKKIVFIGDVLRNNGDGYPADKYIRHIYLLFSEQVKTATGLPAYCEQGSSPLFFNRNLFYSFNNMDATTDNWIKIFNGQANGASIEYFKDCFKDCLLIFKEAGALRNVAKRANIPYVDMYTSVIRFMQDQHLAMRTNVSEIRNVMKKYRLKEEHIKYEANLLRAYYNFKPQLPLESNSLLVCGQTSVDLSLITDDGIISFASMKERLEDLFKNYNKVYYKPHPYADFNSEGEQFIRTLQNVQIVNYNFYKMVCSPQIKAVAALSSGVLQEAPYFEKESIVLSHPYVHYYKGVGECQEDDWMTLTNDYFSPTFWADILSGIMQTNQCEYFNFKNDDNFIRKLTYGWQGYEIGNEANQYLSSQIKHIKDDIEIVKIKSNYSLSKRLRLNLKKMKYKCVWIITKSQKAYDKYMATKGMLKC